MVQERLSDLDELVLRCRNQRSREYIAEAVACYRAGAFRSTIVACWIAFVFDFLEKLRELQVGNDRQATVRLQEFENYRTSHDTTSWLRFEREIPKMAKDEFQLISQMEYEDLERLRLDRHRCAHPSMITFDEAYTPSAELARYHLRNVVAHILQHPPVQGKAAMDRLVAQVKSDLFPTDVESALATFRSGPLSNPRESLIRNFATVLVKDLLYSKELNPRRCVTALIALCQMHHEATDRFLRQRLGDITSGVPDNNLYWMLLLLEAASDFWEFLHDDLRIRLRNHVQNLPSIEICPVMTWALRIPELYSFAVERLRTTTRSELRDLVETDPRREVVDRAIVFYGESRSYASANDSARDLIEPLVPYLSREDVVRILESAQANNQIHGRMEAPRELITIRSAQIVTGNEWNELLTNSGLNRTNPSLRFLEEQASEGTE